MNIVDLLTLFLKDIGLEIVFTDLPYNTFLPGLRIKNGVLIIDKQKLLYPGDILHESGHLAVMPSRIRYDMSDDLGNDPVHNGGEMMAIAWSYAVCIYLNIDPHIVFHPEGYKGGGHNLVDDFANGRYIGVPLLQWCGMTYDDKRAKQAGVKPYPYMVSWVCERDKYKTTEE